MKQTIRDEQRIEHIWHCLSRIQAVAATTAREDLPNNESAQESLFFNLMVLGEAANHLSDEFHAAHPEIPWSKIIGMRNVLIHDYSDIALISPGASSRMTSTNSRFKSSPSTMPCRR